MAGSMADASPDPTMPDVSWLTTIQSHPIFEQGTALASRPPRRAIAVRNTDLLVAVGTEIRMTSLLEIKHQGSTEWPLRSPYKVLASDALDFHVTSIVVNPTGKFLIAMGTHRIAVVVLPRPGTVSSVGTSIPVNAGLVGKYWHHESSGRAGAIADCKWHPWGHNGTSLVVLTRDGQLREYDVSEDINEPMQSEALFPSSSMTKSSPITQKAQRHRSTRSRSRSTTPLASMMKRSGSSTLSRSVRAGSSRIGLDMSEEGEDDEDLDHETTQSQGRWKDSISDKSAVAFSFGLDTRSVTEEGGTSNDADTSSAPSDWNPLTVFGLQRNGDVYALCPFLPKRASIPSAYIHALSSFVSSTRSSATKSSSISFLQRDLQLRFLSSILKQAQADRKQSNVKRERSTFDEAQTLRSRRSVSATPMSLDPRASEPPEDDELGLEGDEYVFIEAPSIPIIPLHPQLQGPFLFTPEPHELSTERESRATDMFFARITTSEQGEGPGVHALGIVSDDGRLDLCVLLESLIPKWPKGARSALKPHSSGRYALSDSDEDDIDDLDSEVDQALPSLLVYETIDLGILDTVDPNSAAALDKVDAALAYSSPSFEADPLYSDTIYVHHVLGVHAINMGRWARMLANALSGLDHEQGTANRTPTKGGDETGPSSLERFLHKSIATDVACIVKTAAPSLDDVSATAIPIVGIAIVSDIYLSYSFLALTLHGRIVSLELDLRADESDGEGEGPEKMGISSGAENKAPLAYTSLLGDGPAFRVPEDFGSGSKLPSRTRTALGRAGGNQELRVTPETLRSLGTTVEELRLEMRKLVKGGNTTQARLDLELREMTRQLNKLVEVNRRAGGEGSASTTRQRMERVMDRQKNLMKRTDGILQKLMEKHHPQLSIYEEQWFQELDRISEEVGEYKGESGDRSGLSARVEQLQHQLSLLKPDLEDVKRSQQQKETRQTLSSGREGGNLGTKQLDAIERLLSSESKMLVEARNKVQDLNHRISQETRVDAF